MGPLRQSRQLQESSIPPSNSTSTGRHIHTKEKDILHKTLGTTGISKSKKPPTSVPLLKTPIPSEQRPSAFNNDTRSSIPPAIHTSRPTWTTEPGNSEQRLHWSTMPLPDLNAWRLHYKIPMSAPFSSESAHISLSNTDQLGWRTPSMYVTPERQPTARREIERAISIAFEEAVIDEDEIVAGFIARREDRRGLERIGTPPEGGGGNVFGTGGKNARPVRCRSDMLG